MSRFTLFLVLVIEREDEPLFGDRQRAEDWHLVFSSDQKEQAQQRLQEAIRALTPDTLQTHSETESEPGGSTTEEEPAWLREDR